MKYTRRHASAAALCFAALTGSAAAASTSWFHGGTDNSALFGVTPDTSQAITWMDNWASEQTANAANFGGAALQVNRPSQFSLNESVMIYGFAGTGLAAVDVTAATLYVRQSFSSINQTWNIVGIANADAGWDNAAMTWNTDGGDDWSGTPSTLGASTVNNYGTFNTTTGVNVNTAIDITAAFQAYLNGAISGIAFINLSNGGTPAGSDNRFVVYSNDNATAANRPGLAVTVIPEPSVALLGALGALVMLRRRRA